MPKYDLSTSSGLRRWARDTARDMNKELGKELKRESRRRPATLPVDVTPRSRPGFAPSRPAFVSEEAAQHVTNNYITTSGQGNQVAIGNHGDVHQQSVISGMSAQDLSELVRQLRLAAAGLELAEDDAAEYSEAVDRIEAEAEKETPSKGRLLRALTSVHLFLRDGGSETVAALAPVVQTAIQALSP